MNERALFIFGLSLLSSSLQVLNLPMLGKYGMIVNDSMLFSPPLSLSLSKMALPKAFLKVWHEERRRPAKLLSPLHQC